MRKLESLAAEGQLGYLFYGSDGRAQTPAPMIVYLHGTDGCGSNPARLLEIESLPQYLETGRIALPENAALLAPQCPVGSNWAKQAEAAMTLIEAVAEAEGIDPARIALTGASLGGMGTFSLGIRYSDRFSCLVPVCGAVEPALCAALTGQPVRIFHGENDTGMGFSAVEADRVIRAAGGDSRLFLLPGEGHEIRWVYATPEFGLIDWMLAQRRSAGRPTRA